MPSQASYELLVTELGELAQGEAEGLKGIKDILLSPTQGLPQIWAKLLVIESKIDQVLQMLTQGDITIIGGQITLMDSKVDTLNQKIPLLLKPEGKTE
jgi:hypothetical protein